MSRKSSGASSAADGNYRIKILQEVFRFLTETGISDEQLRQDVSLAMLANQKSHKPRRRDRTLKLSDAGCILHRWHNDLRYLKKNASPLPLRIRGRAPSIEALVRSERLPFSSHYVVRELKALNLLRRTAAGFIPTRTDAIIRSLSPTTAQYASHAVTRLLSTLTRNLQPGVETPLIERAAFVPDFPEAEMKEFSRFVQIQGVSLTQNVNEWLEAHRGTAPHAVGRSNGRSRKARLVQAGIHVYAFCAPPLEI